MAEPKGNTQIDALYSYLWSAARGQGPFSKLDESLHPRATSEKMYEKLAELGVRPEDVLLDAGCGRGNHSVGLAQRFGCVVVGLDPAGTGLEMGHTAAEQEHLAARVIFQQGSMEALPYPDEVFDLIWCRDVLVHVPDAQRGMEECARVLRPGGVMVIYTTFATDLMEPKESARPYGPLQIVPQNMSATKMESMFVEVGLMIRSNESFAGEMFEIMEETEGRGSRFLLRVARMRRTREKFLAELGQARYEAALAVYEWAIYLALGKLSASLYILQKTQAL